MKPGVLRAGLIKIIGLGGQEVQQIVIEVRGGSCSPAEGHQALHFPQRGGLPAGSGGTKGKKRSGRHAQVIRYLYITWGGFDMPIKLLLDTDIGSDIDDALCLAYLLAQPACELLGITTVTGEAEKRAMIASALCKVAGKNIPVYPGAPEPLLIGQKQQIASQARALGKWDHDTSFPRGEA